MGWAHDGAMTSSTVSTATVTRVSGLGGGELESAAASCVAAAPGPTAAVPRPLLHMLRLVVALVLLRSHQPAALC